MVLGRRKLGFSIGVLAYGKFRLGLAIGQLQTLSLLTLVFGAQALLYVVRERGPLWSSRPGHWVIAATAVDITIVSILALSGTLTPPLPWQVVRALLTAAAALALVLDRIKLRVLPAFGL